MNNKKIIKNALINSVIAVMYITAVVTLMTNMEKGKIGQANNAVLSGIVMLLLFVLSVAVMGVTIFGKPVLWYLDGFKKESVKLVGYTLGFLFIIFIIVLAALIV